VQGKRHDASVLIVGDEFLLALWRGRQLDLQLGTCPKGFTSGDKNGLGSSTAAMEHLD
jgi:hypothetical protein